MWLSFRLNGVECRLEIADPDMPLVFLLREVMNLTGTKYACLEGICGACTVHVAGVAVRSCQIKAAEVEGADVTTIEGLSVDASHPLQRAWIEGQIPQCGYCQSGQIMQAAAFLAKSPNPGKREIAEVMTGNLCRCGAGPRILAGVARAADLIRKSST